MKEKINVTIENIDGTLCCLREEREMYIPYFAIKGYCEAITNNNCQKAIEYYKKYKKNKRFVECHQKWNVELKMD